MAKRRRKSAASSGVRIIKQTSPAPIIKVSAPRAASPRKRRGRRRSHGGGHGGSLSMSTLAKAALGGAVLGFVEKQFPSLPTVPLIGRKGTIVLIAYFLAKKGGSLGHIARDVGLAAAAIAGNELGTTGKVSGDVAPQVHGIASQV